VDEFGPLNLHLTGGGSGPRSAARAGTDHATHQGQASMIRRYIIWRNNHAYDERLRQVVARANVA
jgi:hypothetical protein